MKKRCRRSAGDILLDAFREPAAPGSLDGLRIDVGAKYRKLAGFVDLPHGLDQRDRERIRFLTGRAAHDPDAHGIAF